METAMLNDLLEDEAEKALYENGELDELKRVLRKRRSLLMDEMHGTMKQVDRLDAVIRQTEKELKERKRS